MRVHGQFDIWADNQIIYATIQGSSNAELALSLSDQMKNLAQQQMPAKWGHMVWLDDWELGTPDIEPIIQELTEWCIVHGMTHAAQIFSPSTIKRYQLDKMIVEEKDGFKRRQFRTTDEAKQWLRREGFTLTDHSMNGSRLTLKDAL